MVGYILPAVLHLLHGLFYGYCGWLHTRIRLHLRCVRTVRFGSPAPRAFAVRFALVHAPLRLPARGSPVPGLVCVSPFTVPHTYARLYLHTAARAVRTRARTVTRAVIHYLPFGSLHYPVVRCTLHTLAVLRLRFVTRVLTYVLLRGFIRSRRGCLQFTFYLPFCLPPYGSRLDCPVHATHRVWLHTLPVVTRSIRAPHTVYTLPVVQLVTHAQFSSFVCGYLPPGSTGSPLHWFYVRLDSRLRLWFLDYWFSSLRGYLPTFYAHISFGFRYTTLVPFAVVRVYWFIHLPRCIRSRFCVYTRLDCLHTVTHTPGSAVYTTGYPFPVTATGSRALVAAPVDTRVRTHAPVTRLPAVGFLLVPTYHTAILTRLFRITTVGLVRTRLYTLHHCGYPVRFPFTVAYVIYSFAVTRDTHYTRSRYAFCVRYAFAFLRSWLRSRSLRLHCVTRTLHVVCVYLRCVRWLRFTLPHHTAVYAGSRLHIAHTGSPLVPFTVAFYRLRLVTTTAVYYYRLFVTVTLRYVHARYLPLWTLRLPYGWLRLPSFLPAAFPVAAFTLAGSVT